MKEVWTSDSPQQAKKVNLALALDQYQFNLTKQKATVFDKAIPYKYILLGRQFMTKADLDPDSKGKMQLNLAEAMKATDFNLNSTELIDWEARSHPAQIYNTVKVCPNCYQLYSTLAANYKPQVKRPVVAPSRKQSESSYLPSCSSTARLSQMMRTEGMTLTNLGAINKNSLNDLIADVSHARAELDKTFDTETHRRNLKQVYSTLTTSYLKSTSSLPKKVRRFSPVKVEDDGLQQSLVNKLLPCENQKLLAASTKSTRNLISWQKYLSRLKHNKLGNRDCL